MFAMSKRARIAILSAVFFVAASAIAADLEGRPAPPLEATLLDGTHLDLADLAGKVVLLNYWATWCETCRKEMPALDAYYRRHRDEGLVVLAVSMDDPADIARVRDAAKTFAFPTAMAKSVSARAFGRIWRIPITFVVDRAGVVRKSGWFVESGFDDAALEAAVTPLLRSKEHAQNANRAPTENMNLGASWMPFSFWYTGSCTFV
jgi:peroxiredoxin